MSNENVGSGKTKDPMTDLWQQFKASLNWTHMGVRRRIRDFTLNERFLSCLLAYETLIHAKKVSTFQTTKFRYVL